MVRMKLGLSASEVQEMSMQYALPGGFLVSLDNGAHLRNLSSGFAVQELLTHRDLLTEDDWQPFMHSLRQSTSLLAMICDGILMKKKAFPRMP